MKRLLAFLVTVSIVLSCLSGISLVAFAEDVAGEPIIRGEGLEIQFDGALGAYIIDSAEKFIAIFGENNTEAATDFANDKVYYLTEDITLPADFVPAHGTTTYKSVYYVEGTNELEFYEALPFEGTLKGWDVVNNVEAFKTIDLGGTVENPATRPLVVCKNLLNSNRATYNYFCTGGIFNEVDGATIKYLKIEGNLAFYGLGSKQGYDYGTGFDPANNATWAGTVQVLSGALYGQDQRSASATPLVSYVENYASITSKALKLSDTVSSTATSLHSIGGIGGTSRSAHENCKNFGNLSGAGNVGGILGVSQTTGINVYMTNCYNEGNITSSGTIGGIVGVSYFNFKGCANYGDIIPIGSAVIAGGIAGSNSAPRANDVNYRIEECFNAGEIQGRYAAGMICNFYSGTPARPVDIINSYNIGKISATLTARSAVANIYYTGAGDNFPFTIENYYDLGNDGITLYFENYASDNTYANNVTNANIVGSDVDGDGTKFTLDVLKTGTSYTNLDAIWERDTNAESVYPYPTLKDNIYDNDVQKLFNHISDNTSAKPYFEIASADDFKNKVLPNRSKTGVLFKQTQDITGITNDHIVADFKGIYDGQGKSIDVTLSRETTTANFGLFSSLYGTIRNLTITGTVSSKGVRTGALVGLASSGASLKNITNKATVSGANYVGGVVAQVTTPANTVTHTVEMDSLVNEGTVSGTTFVGGVIGNVNSSDTCPADNKVFKISNCVNKGAVSSSYAAADHCNTGGVIGQILDQKKPGIVHVENCHNEGTVTATSEANTRSLGGVIGKADDARIYKCSNTGTITGAREIGGIVGQYKIYVKDTEGTTGIHSCYNAGDIVTKNSSTSNGAIIGITWFEGETEVSDESPLPVKPLISNCFNVKTAYDAAKGQPIAINLLEGNHFTNNGKYTGTMVYENCYDIAGGNRVSETTVVSLNNVFMINPASNSKGQITVTKEELQNLTKQGGAFYGNSAWYVTTDANNGYLYPLLVGNKEYFVLADITPYALEIDTINGEDYTLTWLGLGTPEKYIVTIDGTVVEEPTEKTLDVTDYVKNEIVTVVVTAVLDDEEKSSEQYSFNGNFGGGDGTEASPYKIYNEEQFENIETALGVNAYFRQEDDLYLEDYICKTTGTAFMGHYDGNNKEVELNLSVSVKTAPVGMFGYIGTATIENLTLTGNIDTVALNSTMGVGGIAGSITPNANKVTFLNCTNKANIDSESYYVAGFLGYGYGAQGGTFTNCVNYGNLKGNQYVAGITSKDHMATYTNCANIGDLTGNAYVAGITAADYGSKYNGCYNLGTITAKSTSGSAIATGIVVSNARIYRWGEADGNTEGLYTRPQEVTVITNCFNAGAVIANEASGIVYQIAEVGSAAPARGAEIWSANISNVYNLATTEYPITNFTDTRVNATLEKVNAVGFGSYNGSKKEMTPIDYTATAPTMSGLYYVGTADDDVAASEALTKEGLKAQSITDFSKSGDYAYPQITANPIPADYDDVDVYLVTLSTDANADASINGVDTTKTLYLPNGTELVVTVTPAVGYDATVELGTGADLGTLIEKGSVQVEIPKGDLAIAVTTSALEGKFTPDFENPLGGTTSSVLVPDETAAPIEIYSESAKADITISRYAVIAGSAKPLAGYKVAEYGILTHTDGGKAINFNNYKYQFKGVKPADAETGFFGILLYGDDQNFEDDEKVGLITDITYYARPYVIYEDALGNKHTAFGEMQSFTIGYDPAEAVQ